MKAIQIPNAVHSFLLESQSPDETLGETLHRLLKPQIDLDLQYPDLDFHPDIMMLSGSMEIPLDRIRQQW